MLKKNYSRNQENADLSGEKHHSKFSGHEIKRKKRNYHLP